MREHIRTIENFLDDWGATNIYSSVTDGGHIRVDYMWKGLPKFALTSKTPSDIRAIKNQLAQIKRELGEPIKLEGRQRRTLDELTRAIKIPEGKEMDHPALDKLKNMMETAPILKNANEDCYISLTPDKLLIILIPDHAYELIGKPKAVLIEREGVNSWEIRPTTGSAGQAIAHYQTTRKGFYRTEVHESKLHPVAHGLGAWGSTKGVCVADKDSVIVSVDLKNLKSISGKTYPNKVKHKNTPIVTLQELDGKKIADIPPLPDPLVTTFQQPLMTTPTREEIKQALEVITRVEATMPMKLVRCEGRYDFKLDLGY